MPEQASFWIMTTSYDVGPFESAETAAVFAATDEEIIADGRDNPFCTIDIWEDTSDGPISISSNYPLQPKETNHA
jgi:hypothetical protein